MMDYFINITITTSITAFIILIVKAVLKNKISPNWQFVIWNILAIRLLVPVFPESKMSIFNSVPQIENIEISQKAVVSIPTESNSFVTGNIVLGEKNKEFIFSEALANNVFYVWAIGAIMMLLFMTIIYYSFHKKTKKLQTLKDPEILFILDKCRKSAGINKNVIVKLGGETPMLKGVVKPEIILPEGYTIDELYSVFTHELLHFKHKDVLWNIIGTVLLCAYWYNPVMWYCFFVFRRDIEILCDYRVLEINKNKKEYSHVLLKTALRKNKFILGTTSLQNGEKDVTKRIKYIAYFKKPKVIWSIAIVVIVALITATCLTNPVAKSYTKINKSNVEKLYEYKTQYVGAAYKVGNLTDYLNYSQYKKGFSLQTESEPYGITINYNIKPGILSQNGVIKVNNSMLENAAIIFCLVNNVDTVTFNFDEEGKVYSFQFKRELFKNVFSRDIREYSSSLKTFKEQFIPMLEKQDWSKIKVPIDFSIGDKVEKNLNIIMSSPKSSSNPSDYIKAHEKEYENILKMGDEALQYMLSLFQQGKAKGLKSHIMMELCIDLLGDRNNVKQGSYNSPEEWYAKLSPYTAYKLPPFKYEAKNNIEQLVYNAAIEKYSGYRKDDGVTIVAPHIFGYYEKGNELRIFTTVYYSSFKLYDKILSQDSAGIVPAAIIYVKNNDGSYSFKKYIEAMDGDYFRKSIEEFCKPRDDIAKAIMKHYSNYDDLFKLMKENTTEYLKSNGLKGINLKQSNGEVIPLT